MAEESRKNISSKNFIPHNEYFLVRRDLTIVSSKGEKLSYSEFIEKLHKLLKEKQTVVIDEFQRLPEEFVDEVSLLHPSGRLILLGSSLRIIYKVFSPKSPLLGLVSTYRLELVKPADILVYLSKILDPVHAVELAPVMREPWLLKYLTAYKGDTVALLYEIIKLNIYTIKSLVGEIFTEEERELTARYEAILTAVASGNWNTKQITSILFNKGLVDRPDIGLVRQYIINLIEMNLLESTPIINKREKYIKIASPIIDLYYYLNDKYNIEEENLPPLSEIKDSIKTKLSLYIQDYIAKLFSQIHEAKTNYYITSTLEIDFILTKKRKTLALAEVKWRTKPSAKAIKTFLQKTSKIQAEKRILITKTKPHKKTKNIKIYTPTDLIKEAEKHIQKTCGQAALSKLQTIQAPSQQKL
ncbi:MAG: hypothetical protein DRJ63_09890 [Thermoprotei archaeon]|nr:MAG: hypothetical protein DRJ63_09890 [Thermoprotei archaeon]